MKERVEELLEEAFEQRPDLFLLELNMGSNNEIHLVIDGDDNVKVADCIFISRAVEHNLDREEVDFSLSVTSAGVGKPLTHKRQYAKNIGRKIEVEDVDGKKESGTLTSVTDTTINLEWKAREPKPVGKGKITVDKSWELSFEKIRQAKIVITFN